MAHGLYDVGLDHAAHRERAARGDRDLRRPARRASAEAVDAGDGRGGGGGLCAGISTHVRETTLRSIALSHEEASRRMTAGPQTRDAYAFRMVLNQGQAAEEYARRHDAICPPRLVEALKRGWGFGLFDLARPRDASSLRHPDPAAASMAWTRCPATTPIVRRWWARIWPTSCRPTMPTMRRCRFRCAADVRDAMSGRFRDRGAAGQHRARQKRRAAGTYFQTGGPPTTGSPTA